MPLVRTKESASTDLFLIIIAIILPPVAMLLETGLSKQFLINLILTMIGFVPGVVHAVYVIART